MTDERDPVAILSETDKTRIPELLPPTTTKPLNPDQAPVATVDHFSEKAAHLQLRTSENHLPGPNEPVDFDTGPFITQGLSPSTGKPVQPIGPIAIGEDGKPSCQTVSASFDLRCLDPD